MNVASIRAFCPHARLNQTRKTFPEGGPKRKSGLFVFRAFSRDNNSAHTAGKENVKREVDNTDLVVECLSRNVESREKNGKTNPCCFAASPTLI